MLRPARALLAVAAFAGALASAPSAHAEPSAWVFVGGGPMGWKQEDAAFKTSGAMQFDVGIGTRPDAPVIVGGLFRMTPFFGSGTDLALLARAATRGFQEARFGLALDAGGYERFWGATSRGFAGALNVGLPLGFTLSLQTEVGTDRAVTLGGVAGIDLARLTVYRRSLLNFWPNTGPAQKPRDASVDSPGRW
jgi:hypothetical protein